MATKLLPIACPVCGECQNSMPGRFDPTSEPFGPVTCMVCGHAFTRAEYEAGLAERNRQFETLKGPGSEP